MREMAKLKPWYKVVTPRKDLREGKPLDASEFAVHLDQVRDGRAHEDYQKPARFFERTFLTKNLLDTSAEVMRRLEVLSFKESVFQSILMLGFAYAAGLLCWYALKRYGSLMSEAKRLAARSACPECRAYGAFSVIAEYPKISVRCHTCSHEWQID